MVNNYSDQRVYNILESLSGDLLAAVFDIFTDNLIPELFLFAFESLESILEVCLGDIITSLSYD
jgi:hypothetical protein